MKKIFSFIIVGLVCGLLPAGMEAATHNVSAIDFAFVPNSLVINAGDTVTWTNNSSTLHTTTSGSGCSPDGLWNASLSGSGSTFSRTFNTPGTFPYYCIPHCGFGMTGTITVTGASGLPAPSGQQTFFFSPVEAPVVSTAKSGSSPIGIGTLASGGSTFTGRIAIGQYASAVDIYAAFTVSTDPLTIINITPTLAFQSFTLSDIAQALSTGAPPAGAAPWRANVTSAVDETLFSMPVSGLPPGQYTAYLLVTPTGGTLANFDLYQTVFTVGVSLVTSLSGDQEVPPVATAATGTAQYTVDIVTGAINGTLTFSGLSSAATAAHIHEAAAGVNGAVILPLSGGAGATSGTWTISGTLTPEQLTALGNNQLYLNVHSANFSGGEIRGQIIYPAGFPLP